MSRSSESSYLQTLMGTKEITGLGVNPHAYGAAGRTLHYRNTFNAAT
ncbi:MAG: hypothetical protein ABW160_20195 [Candidatus Thiodiazotropha sp. 4PDIV1]